MRKLHIITALALCAVLLMGAAAPTAWTSRQTAAHQIAELARSMGLDEGHPIIQEAKAIWWEEANLGESMLEQQSVRAISENGDFPKLEPAEEPLYTEEELNILAKVIWREAWGCPWEHMLSVGCVVLNRVADDRFPGTIYDVVTQPGQYSASYVSNFSDIPGECYEAARMCLNGEFTIPPEVVWQANFPQGNGIWWQSYVDTGWFRSVTYFCY